MPRKVQLVKKQRKRSLTEMATQALTEAVAKVVEDHQQSGRPLAVWREGKAVWIAPGEAMTLRGASVPYQTTKPKR